jgi:hypothetical protein
LRNEADDVVENGGSLEETRGQIRRIWTRWMGPAQEVSPELTLGKGTEVEVERTK